MGTIYGYGRVSTDSQKPSLVRQEEGIEAFLKSQRVIGKYKGDVYAGFVFDEEVSGSTFWGHRNQGSMIDANLEQGDTVIVTNFDRLFRRTADCALTLDDFQKRGITLVIMDFQIDTSTPHGAMAAHIFAAVKEHERHAIRERCAAGQKNRSRLCKISNRVICGWKKIASNHYVPDEEQRRKVAEVGKEAWEQQITDNRELYRLWDSMGGCSPLKGGPPLKGAPPRQMNRAERTYNRLPTWVARWILGFPLCTNDELLDFYSYENEPVRLTRKTNADSFRKTLYSIEYVWQFRKKVLRVGTVGLKTNPQALTEERLGELETIRRIKKFGKMGLYS